MFTLFRCNTKVAPLLLIVQHEMESQIDGYKPGVIGNERSL